MTAVRSFISLYIGMGLQFVGGFFTWFLGMFRAQEPPTQWYVLSAPPEAGAASPSVSVRSAPVVVPPSCEVCGAPSTGLRSHDGHWRCLAHKGVTCDVCGRAVIEVVTLPDQAWTCATHG